MNKLSFALVALALAAPAAAQETAPPVKRKPVAAAPAAPQTERHYQSALTAAASQDGSDSALDASLIRGMSRLLAAGKCGEAASLATRDGRKELASRAQQLCK
jgi:hypothetical protein